MTFQEALVLVKKEVEQGLLAFFAGLVFKLSAVSSKLLHAMMALELLGTPSFGLFRSEQLLAEQTRRCWIHSFPMA